MPVTSGNEIRTVADIIKAAIKCSDADANQAEIDVCKRPSTLTALLLACGLSTYAVSHGGVLFQSSVVTGPAGAISGIALGTIGLMGAARFCGAAVKLKSGSFSQLNEQ